MYEYADHDDVAARELHWQRFPQTYILESVHSLDLVLSSSMLLCIHCTPRVIICTPLCEILLVRETCLTLRCPDTEINSLDLFRALIIFYKNPRDKMSNSKKSGTFLVK